MGHENKTEKSGSMASPDLFHSATSSLANALHNVHNAGGEHSEERALWNHFVRQITLGKAQSTSEKLWLK